MTKTQAISLRILTLVAEGMGVRQALDTVCGAGKPKASPMPQNPLTIKRTSVTELIQRISDSGFADRITVGNKTPRALIRWFVSIEDRTGKSVETNVAEWIAAHTAETIEL